jgi:hypothetical protein
MTELRPSAFLLGPVLAAEGPPASRRLALRRLRRCESDLSCQPRACSSAMTQAGLFHRYSHALGDDTSRWGPSVGQCVRNVATMSNQHAFTTARFPRNSMRTLSLASNAVVAPFVIWIGQRTAS